MISSRAPFTVLICLALAGLVLVPVIAFRYGYSDLTFFEAAAGFFLLIATGAGAWFFFRRRGEVDHSGALRLGLGLGLLWAVEISINNFIAPPLPARDIIDDTFWAAIALAILAYALARALRTGSLLRAIQAGAWSGLSSGLLACVMALAVIVFGMESITRDPLNVAEWAARGTAVPAPSMVAYFAFETFAGAFLHLVVLGLAMGLLLGLVGGLSGKGLRSIKKIFNHETHENHEKERRKAI